MSDQHERVSRDEWHALVKEFDPDGYAYVNDTMPNWMINVYVESVRKTFAFALWRVRREWGRFGKVIKDVYFPPDVS